MSIDVHIDYAADDSCQIRLWSRGNHSDDDFLKACEKELIAWDGRGLALTGKPVKHTFYRTVKADSETKALMAFDTVRVESKQGKGAYEVTILNEWLPLFTHII